MVQCSYFYECNTLKDLLDSRKEKIQMKIVIEEQDLEAMLENSIDKDSNIELSRITYPHCGEYGYSVNAYFDVIEKDQIIDEYRMGYGEIIINVFNKLGYNFDDFNLISMNSYKDIIGINQFEIIFKEREEGTNMNKECQLQELIDEYDLRQCSVCNKPMMDGYCHDGGTMYYCSDECLHRDFTDEEWAEVYDEGNGESYWTEWEDEFKKYHELLDLWKNLQQ